MNRYQAKLENNFSSTLFVMSKLLTLTLCCLFLLSCDPTPRLIGITYTFEPYPDSVVSIDPVTAVTEDIGSTGFNYLNSLAQDNRRGEFYAVSDVPSDSRLIRIDPTTWVGTDVGQLTILPHMIQLSRIRGLAYNEYNERLLAIQHIQPTELGSDDGDTSLYHVNKYNGQAGYIGKTGFSSIQSIAFAYSEGAKLYGWDIHEGLVTIDVNTGLATDVNPLVPGTTAIQGIAFTPDGRLFGAQYELFSINVATGEYTLIGRTGRNVRGLVYVTDLP